MPHRLVWHFSTVIEIWRERGAQRYPVVRGRRLHKEPIHEAGSENLPVGFRIQRHTPGKTNISAARLLYGHPLYVHHCAFASILHGVGDVFVAVRDLAFRHTRRSQQPRHSSEWRRAVCN